VSSATVDPFAHLRHQIAGETAATVMTEQRTGLRHVDHGFEDAAQVAVEQNSVRREADARDGGQLLIDRIDGLVAHAILGVVPGSPPP
jgi:hypothetical protein